MLFVCRFDLLLGAHMSSHINTTVCINMSTVHDVCHQEASILLCFVYSGSKQNTTKGHGTEVVVEYACT